MDTAWAETRNKQIKAEADRLDAELKGYKNNLIKESIRVRSLCIVPEGTERADFSTQQMGNEDLGNFCYATGDFPAAAKAYTRMRDYATLPKHIAEMTLRQTLVALAQRAWMPASAHLIKLRNLHPSLPPVDKPRFDHVGYALAGLAEMGGRNFRDAAAYFLCVDPQVFAVSSSSAPGSAGGDVVAGIVWTRAVLTPNDVAVYGGLCALASMTRGELQTRVLDSSTFRAFLELEPHVRRAIAFFVNAKYAQCLSTLEAYRSDWLLDIYLQPLVADIFAVVRQKCIVQYFEAFSCVSLDELARHFPPTITNPSSFTNNGTTTASTLELIRAELRSLIDASILPARLDLPNNQLVAPPANPRREVLLAALDDAAEYERTLRLRLSRINMVAAGMEVKAATGEGRAGGEGTSGPAKSGKVGKGGRGFI